MIQNLLRSIGGVGNYGVISICLFFAAFVGVVIWVLRLKRSYLNSMRDLPLHDEPESADPARSPSHSEARHE